MKNFKKIMAVALAFVICATTGNAVVADATVITNDNTDGNGYYVKMRELDGFNYTYDEVYGITFYLGIDKFKDGEYPNGAIGPNSKSTGWATIEFAVEGKELVFNTSNNSVTYLSSSPVFTEDDFTKEDFYNEFLIVNYGSPADFSVDDWAILGKGGKKLWTMSGGDVNASSSSDDKKESGSDSKTSTEKGSLPKTGVVSTSVFVGIGATLIGAGVALRRKEDEE